MLRNSLSKPNENAEGVWSDVESLLDELTQFALHTQSAREFHSACLARAVAAIDGCGGAMWLRDHSAGLTLDASHGDVGGMFVDAAMRQEHAAVVLDQIERHSTGQSPIRFAVQQRGKNSSELLTAILVAVGDEREMLGVLEVLVAENASPLMLQSQANVLSAFAEIATDFHRRNRVCELRAALDRWESWNESYLRVHARLDQRSTGYVMANELRMVAGCDRVTVLVWRRARLRVLAISGMASFDSRSPIVREAERLALAVAGEDRAVWYSETDPRDEATWMLLRSYLDQSPARALGAIGLRSTAAGSDSVSHRGLGVVVCERFEQRPFQVVERQAIEHFGRHASVAVGRAAEWERFPLIGVSRMLRRFGLGTNPRSRLGTLAWLILATVAVTVAGMWPVDFAIRTPGVLQPVQRREVFAPSVGVVREVRVHQGDRVAAGDVLLVLHNDDVELEITRLYGELQTAGRQLQAVQASRLDTTRASPDARFQSSQLTAEEERLKEVIRSLELQHQRRLTQRDDLTVRSPMAGEVLTWDVERVLRSRPVERGQRLMTIAQVNADWLLELRVADADVGHVMQAKQPSSATLPVAFRIVSEPTHKYDAKLTNISGWTDAHDEQGPSVLMTAAIEDLHGSAVRPGATVAAEIHLGSRPRAYVWFRDVLEFIRIHVWF